MARAIIIETTNYALVTAATIMEMYLKKYLVSNNSEFYLLSNFHYTYCNELSNSFDITNNNNPISRNIKNDEKEVLNMIKVTGGNYYGMQGRTNNKTGNQLKAGTFEGFFRKDTFSKTASRVIEVNNYYTAKTTGKKAPYPSSNCYVEDVEGAQAALDKLKAEADSFDYTGMSDGEIFMSIFNRYSDYFGDDFLNYNWQQDIVDKGGIEKANKNMASRIRTQFSSEMNYHVENRQEAYKYYYGYEGMTDEEMRMEIYAEFAFSGTYASFYKMADKLHRTGLISQEEHCELTWMINTVQFYKKQPPLSIMLYEKYGHLLGGYEEHMDIDELLKIFEENEKYINYYGPNVEKVKADVENAKEIFRELRDLRSKM